MLLLFIYLVYIYMLIELLEIGALLAVVILPLFFPYKKKVRAIKIPKNHNDTSEANYAINEHGFLEEIQHDNLKSHAD
ncbi:MAG: hypothetical protein JWQ54_4529 [Mucilaginibacter sp.]|nr:hypothetical protein [Mucilaginibacter sp.]